MTQRFTTFAIGFLALLSCASESAVSQTNERAVADRASNELLPFVRTYCLDCHRKESEEARLPLDELIESPLVENASHWESVVSKLQSRQMPPIDSPRPSETEYLAAVDLLTKDLDAWSEQHPVAGFVETFRRLTRTEYQNAIRDLLDLEIDVTDMLPADESSHGFDNVTVTNLSPVLLDRYVTAARKISRLAVGVRADAGAEDVYRIRPDVTQDVHVPGAPIGTRGGAVIRHHFPQDGEYEVQVRLMRDRNDEIESLRGKHEIEVLIDREQRGAFKIERPRDGSSDKLVDANLTIKVRQKAGPHDVSVVFPEQSSSLLESVRQPLNVHFNFYRHPRLGPAIYEISVRGPYEGSPPVDTPSRRRIFSVYPTGEVDEAACAEQILTRLARRAYRRELNDADTESLMKFYHQASKEAGFDAGIESALGAMLVSPHFLFRIERESQAVKSKTAKAISDHELATRLAFFLWSSLPDDTLLDLAKERRLKDPETLDAQVRRMLADDRAASLTSNFAGQWLYLRNLESFVPDMRLYADFDDNLRRAMRSETELFFQSIVQENRPVLDLISADYTFLNERLAKHYEIPNVYGSHFRRVTLDKTSRRGGLLRHGSILAVTSYATRTSPVVRGHWVLKNVLGNAPPPPPPNVPALEDNTVDASLSLRERLEQHRANASCASCHNLMDPVGFALENFDAIGRWRESDLGEPIDPNGKLWDGTELHGVEDLEKAILARPNLFVQTLTEKLMTYALGRGIESFDAPAVRKVVRDSQSNDYRMTEVILGIVKSVPFQMRSSQ